MSSPRTTPSTVLSFDARHGPRATLTTAAQAHYESANSRRPASPSRPLTMHKRLRRVRAGLISTNIGAHKAITAALSSCRLPTYCSHLFRATMKSSSAKCPISAVYQSLSLEVIIIVDSTRTTTMRFAHGAAIRCMLRARKASL